MGKIIFANWKEKITDEESAVLVAQATDFHGAVILPPHRFLGVVRGVLRNAEYGMQDYAPDGFMRGARYTLVGHTDRRAAGDTDDIIAEKLALAARDGIVPVLCIGESRTERDSGMTLGVIRRQARIGLSLVSRLRLHAYPVYIAYEPLWAISTGPDKEQCSPQAAVRRIASVKEHLLHLGYGVTPRYLYGGSVTGKNAGEYLACHDIDGLLVGALSINKEEFKTIWHSASKS
jgi:triosephosphate isomerase